MVAAPHASTMRRLLPLAFLLVVVTAALAQSNPGTGPATDEKSSKCIECHRPGGAAAGSPLSSAFSLRPPAKLPIEQGEPVRFEVTLRNDWVARLDRIYATLDLTDAPAFAFGEPPAPKLDVSKQGQLVLDNSDPTQLAAERTARVTLEVPSGATAVRFRLVPLTTGPTAPDLVLRLWDPHANPNGSPQNEVDDGGLGATEVFRLRDVTSVVLRGTGQWTLEAAQLGPVASPQIGFLVDQSVKFVVDAWFNQTATRTSTLASNAQLDGQTEEFPTTTLTWDLFVTGTPRDGDRMSIHAEADAYYQHAPQFGALDEWRFYEDLVIPIRIPKTENVTDPGEVTLNTTTTSKPVIQEDALVVTPDAIGEAVGYAAVFLYASSTFTGGMFGLRKAFNRLFGAAKRRIAFHNAVSYLLIAFASAHTVLFILEGKFHWSVGLLWGTASMLGLTGLAFTGALQIPMIRGMGYGWWRFLHYALAVLTILLTAVHMGLDGIHFEWLQKELQWSDPVVKAFS